MKTTGIVQQDEAAIKNLMDDVITAFNKADLDKLLSLHTDDIILMEPNIPIIQGKQKIRELFYEFEKKKISLNLSFNIEELEIMDKRAFVRGQVFKTMVINGSVSDEDKGKFICLLQKQPDGKWLRTHVIVNNDAPDQKEVWHSVKNYLEKLSV